MGWAWGWAGGGWAGRGLQEAALSASTGHVFHVESADKVPIPQNAFYTILNTAIYPSVHDVGAWFGADERLPVYHYIDWVRVYQLDSR